MALGDTSLQCMPWNHRMPWLGRDRNNNLAPNVPCWTGAPSAGPGSSKPHPSWSGTLPGIRNQ